MGSERPQSTIPAQILKLLNRRVRNRTHGGVRGRSLKAPPTRLETVLVDVTNEEGIATQLEEIQPILDAEGNPQLDPQYVEEAPPQGLYLPQYLNGVWVEGGIAPEPTTPQLSTDEKLTQLAEQLVITQTELEVAQEALDFLLIGGM